MEIHIHIHHHSDPCMNDVIRRVGALEEGLRIMHEEFKAAVTKLEAATTAVGERLDKLASQIEGGLSADEAAPIVTELNALGNKLAAMGKDPSKPDPVDMPQPATTAKAKRS